MCKNRLLLAIGLLLVVKVLAAVPYGDTYAQTMQIMQSNFQNRMRQWPIDVNNYRNNMKIAACRDSVVRYWFEDIMRVVTIEVTDKVRTGQWDAKTNVIWLRQGDDVGTLLHELVHAWRSWYSVWPRVDGRYYYDVDMVWKCVLDDRPLNDEAEAELVRAWLLNRGRFTSYERDIVAAYVGTLMFLVPAGKICADGFGHAYDTSWDRKSLNILFGMTRVPRSTQFYGYEYVYSAYFNPYQ